MEAALGAHQKSTFLKRHMVKQAGLGLAVTFHHPKRDQEGVLVKEPGDTLTLSTGKKDLHQELSGAGTVGGHPILSLIHI